jgi:hypothetical protein
MVRMELCSTRTMGSSAWSGIVGGRGGGCVLVGVVVLLLVVEAVRLRQ